jgi:serine/threonine protein kinase
MSEQLLDRRYLIVEVLSQGGFGRTFLAKDTKRPGDPICVVKQLYPANSQPELLEKAQKLFTQEAEILHKLGEHPQIPRLLAYFEENSDFYIVQEYIVGETLDQELISEQPLPEIQVIEFLLELLEILTFVHTNFVIHRDLKPSNIIRKKQNNKLVLIDFGAVKKVTNQVNDKTIAIGTPAYIPIEQLSGQPNFCSDIYAVGMLGIKAITGLHFAPHIGGGLDTDAQGEIIWQPYAKVSDDLAVILAKMVRHNYRDRYQTATEAIQAIQNLTNNRSASTLINQKKSKHYSSNNVDSTVLNQKKLETYSNNHSASTVINQKKNKTSFKLINKILIFAGITSIVITVIKLAIDNLVSPRLPLNGQLVSGTLEHDKICEDLKVACQEYLLKGKSGQRVSIEMDSNNFDPSLVLYTPDGEKLEASEDVSPDNWNSKITVNLPVNGNYVVVTKTYTQGESGNYKLRALNINN